MKKTVKEPEVVVTLEEKAKKLGTCGCGRSPTGDCIGWHGLGEDEFRQKLAEYDAKLIQTTRTFG